MYRDLRQYFWWNNVKKEIAEYAVREEEREREKEREGRGRGVSPLACAGRPSSSPAGRPAPNHRE